MKRFFLFFLLAAITIAHAQAGESKPNIILIFTDDQGYNDLGCFGSTTIKTPNLDRMAAEGLKLTNFYAQPVCGVSRAALMTGSYPIRVGEPDNIKQLHTVPHPEEVTMAEMLKSAGYATGIIGKWHLTNKGDGTGGFEPTTMPNAQGFDYFYGTPVYNGYTVYVDDVPMRVPIYRNDEVVVEGVDSWDNITADYTKEAIDYIEQNKDQPFFLYLAHNMPHIPVGASENFKGKSEYGPYGDTIEEIDWSTGQILDKLKELGLDENTLIVFTSDNGPWVETTRGMKPGRPPFIPRDHSGSAAPLRGWKMSAWDGGSKVPFIAHWPKKIAAGSESDEILSTMDLLPTFANLAGAELPADRTLDGHDATGFLLGKTDESPRDDYLYYSGCLLTGIRVDQWKLVLPRPNNPPGTGWWGRMIEEIKEVQLYDLDADPGETTNVADQHPEVIARLTKRIDSARAELGDMDVVGSGARSFDPGSRTIQGPRSKKAATTKPSATTPAAQGKRSHPNVVLIFADDLGYGDLGCYGATKVRTPNIDMLAAEGRKFTDAHSASAVCTPSRYGLLTGEYPFRANGGKGLWGPAQISSHLLIPTETQTIADVLKSANYDTAAFGKWHLGFKEGKNDWQEPLRPGPQDLGFDYYFGMPVVNSAPPYVYVENDRVVGGDPADPLVYVGRNVKDPSPLTPITREAGARVGNHFKGAVEAHKEFNDYEVGTRLTKEATEWIAARGENPFFLYFSTTNVHHPFTPAERFQGTSEAGAYGDFVHELDWIVGEVMKSLEAAGVADNTLVIFTSDNGGMFNEGGRVAAEMGHKINGDLLGSKFGIWEGGHRVPFIARWPGKIEAGSVSDQLLCSTDLLASFAALTGQQLDDPKDSINMLPALIENPDKPLRTEMFMTPNKQSHMALRRGKWMYIPAQSDGGFTGSKPGQHAWGGAAVTTLVGTPSSDIEDGEIIPGAPPAQLYDLKADRNQTKNVYYEHPDVTQKMADAIKKAKQDAGSSKSPATKPRSAESANAGGAPLAKYDDFAPVGNLRYSFESGELDGWKVTEGKLGEPVTTVPSLTNRKDLPFARHGSYHLSTLVPGDDKPLSDTQTGVVQSPAFKLTGDKVAFLVSGGHHEKDLFVALVDVDSGDVLMKSGGSRDPRMRRIKWDVSKWKGQTVRFEVIDRITGGWGHLNVDDFSVEGELVTASSKTEAKAGKMPAKAERSAQASRPSGEKPNIVVIFADDLGYGDLGCYGAKYPTPALDQMAAEGFRSTDMISASNVCTPSRAALLTGRYPSRAGLPTYRIRGKKEHYGLHPDELTIAELLKPAGYRSLAVGKWHIGFLMEGAHPMDQGFDEYFGLPYNYTTSHDPWNQAIFRDRKMIEANVKFPTITPRYNEEVVRFIKDHPKDEPFFIYMAHQIAHTPIVPGKPFLGKSKEGKYADFVTELDHSVGQVLQALRDDDLDDNTLVVFLADNGHHGKVGSGGPLAGSKYTTMEGGHRVPGIFRWPGTIPAGKVSDATLTSMDLLPLFCDLAGVELPTDRTIDGKNIRNVLLGQSDESPHQFLYYYNGHNLQAVRKGKWKLHLPRTAADQPYWGAVSVKRSFVKLDQPFLVNLETDIGEKYNVAVENPEVVTTLLKEAERIRSELGDVGQTGSDQRALWRTELSEF